MKIWKRLTILAPLLLLMTMASASFAQGPPPRRGHPSDRWGPLGQGGFNPLAEARFDGKVVKGAPYSAKAVTEITQTLSDGTHIVRKSTSLLYRDSEGRTRREQDVSAMTPFASADSGRQVVFISDPVAGFYYVLSPEKHSGRKFSRQPGAQPPDSSITFSSEGKVESLGKQKMEGVDVEGTRSTITIPVGQIGNDRPINIVSERWYSPELQLVVMSKHNDPRIGEHTYRLTEITRNEPAHSLFEVPSDYQLQEGMRPEGSGRRGKKPMFD